MSLNTIQFWFNFQLPKTLVSEIVSLSEQIYNTKWTLYTVVLNYSIVLDFKLREYHIYFKRMLYVFVFFVSFNRKKKI